MLFSTFLCLCNYDASWQSLASCTKNWQHFLFLCSIMVHLIIRGSWDLVICSILGPRWDFIWRKVFHSFPSAKKLLWFFLTSCFYTLQSIQITWGAVYIADFPCHLPKLWPRRESSGMGVLHCFFVTSPKVNLMQSHAMWKQWFSYSKVLKSPGGCVRI